ncbi:uncharacterized protein SAPINGB_P002817 [Magnusiomyces paraingens]|uniref:Protein sym1 n=1 Tax=Magnusiomyces paraingens TaxID=2606893 RepID=A0A5E8BLR3_9ASCO|nr:uncharacterized protein SAPINGB_P002817 [Saprochaete ingens]VVT50598.1 unnamed protein product [Saprochaete ingens]
MSKDTTLELGPLDKDDEKRLSGPLEGSTLHKDRHRPRHVHINGQNNNPQQVAIGAVIASQIASLVLIGLLYPRLYSISPFGSSAIVSTLLCGFSQGLLQLIVHRRLNPSALLKFYCWGIINGLWTKWWTSSLSVIVPSIPLRIFCDQAIGNPTNLLIFLSFVSYWDGREIETYFHQTYFKMLKTSYIIWPFVSTIQFYLLDPRLIVPFCSVVNVFWTVILGIITG